MDSKKQREELKEEYKKHYRQMREAKERLRRTQKTQKITAALQDMDTGELMESFDNFLFEIKSTVAHAEAKIDVALEDLEVSEAEANNSEKKSRSRKVKARETLKKLKNEMGLLYNEIENKAESLEVEKTVGPAEFENEDVKAMKEK